MKDKSLCIHERIKSYITKAQDNYGSDQSNDLNCLIFKSCF